MTAYVALLRAVNVSGTGKLPMAELKAMGEACGFGSCRTFIASGNLLFTSELSEAGVRERIGERVDDYFGRHVPVYVRGATEMAEVAKRNPFTDDKPSAVMAHFVDEEPIQSMLDEARDVQGERMALGARLIYISYGAGIADSKLKMPILKLGTARNMNTVAKIADLLAGME